MYGRPHILMPEMVCVATHFIEDEELFFNYRYNPDNPYPEWYSQPDLDEAKRRWGKMHLLYAWWK